MHRIEVRLKSHLPDPSGRGLVKDIQDLGISSVEEARVVDVYWLDANLAPEKLELICSSLLADGVTQDYRYSKNGKMNNGDKDFKVVEVAYNAGVTDPVKDSVMKAIKDLGIPMFTPYPLPGDIFSRAKSARANWRRFRRACSSIRSFNT